MKNRHQSKRSHTIALFALVLFLLLLSSSCGVPTFLYIGESESDIIMENNEDRTRIDVTVELTDDAISEFRDKGATPAVKLFYVLSTNILSTTTISDYSSLTVSSNVRSAFNKLYAKSDGNGEMWTANSLTEAPGFYIVDTEDTSVKYQIEKPDYEEDVEYDVIPVSTFSYNTIPNAGGSFATAPDMDIALSLDDFTHVTDSLLNTITFSIVLEDNLTDSYCDLALFDKDDVRVGYMNNVRKEQFFSAHSSVTAEQIIDRYSDGDDSFTYRVFTEALDDSSPVYLHIFASIYGGNGDSTNIFWTQMESSVGTIQLR